MIQLLIALRWSLVILPKSISRPPTHIWLLSALFVSFIYRQSPAGIWSHIMPAKNLCCSQLQSSKLVGFHSLVETQDGAEVGHDSIGDDENLPSATNPKRCTGQCRGSVVCRYTNPATQSCNRIIFLNIYQLQCFKEGLGE